MSRLYVWQVVVQPNDRIRSVVASTIESAIELAVIGMPQGKAVSAIRGASVDCVEQQEKKEHPYR